VIGTLLAEAMVMSFASMLVFAIWIGKLGRQHHQRPDRRETTQPRARRERRSSLNAKRSPAYWDPDATSADVPRLGMVIVEPPTRVRRRT
jgi:hypothetical protein